jgi:hypothetical protein
MKMRYFKVTAIVAVTQYEAEDLCDEHASLGTRTALDAVELINDSDAYLLELTEEELFLTPAERKQS